MLKLFFVELRRKAIHAAGSIIPVAYYFTDRETAVIGLAIINAVLLTVEWLRLTGRIKLPEILLRPHENKQVAAYIYFQIAALISIFVFEKTIAIAAILMLALGDTASGLAGALMDGGNVRHSRQRFIIKPFPIMAVMFAVCVLIGALLQYLPLAPDMNNISFWIYAAGALGATLGDAIPLQIKGRPIDDNLMIPLLSGVFMTIANLL
ncbi:membrane protein [groundwater metagenome]